jgi:RHS repeat-associated protein
MNGRWQWAHTNIVAGALSATYDADFSGNTSGPLYFHLSDWLGTRRQQTDYTGNPLLNFTGLPFGDGLTTIPISTTDAADATEHHFTGKERDTESGNDYFGARYYSSSMGRFLSPDWSAKQEPVPYAKLDNPQSLNLYAYVTNNPMTRFDADGHCGEGPNGWVCPPDFGHGPICVCAAQQQSGSSGGGGFWSGLKHGFSNLLHFHSWGYIKATVSAEDVGPQIPLVTGATDAAGLAAAATKSTPLGVVSAAASVANDHSTQNKITNGLGLIPGLDWPMAITGAFNDLFDYGIHNNNPLDGKTWQNDRNIDSGSPGSGASGNGGSTEGGGGSWDECQMWGCR